MYLKKIMQTTLIIAIGSFFWGCSSKIPANKGGYYYNHIYFGSHLTKSYKRGVRDGCSTAKGKYTKSHWFFQNKKEYVDGWFMGRNKCRGLLKIDKNGDLIL